MANLSFSCEAVYKKFNFNILQTKLKAPLSYTFSISDKGWILLFLILLKPQKYSTFFALKEFRFVPFLLFPSWRGLSDVPQ